MRRTIALACLVAATALLPLQAEAARFRLGGRGSTPAIKAGRSLVVVPGATAASRPQAAATGKPDHVPFPPSSANADKPAPLRLSTNDEEKQPWCRRQVVVGGFCMMN
ncbi:hypothetical protein [Bosea sp. (in: a-proteobacteria)]